MDSEERFGSRYYRLVYRSGLYAPSLPVTVPRACQLRRWSPTEDSPEASQPTDGKLLQYQYLSCALLATWSVVRSQGPARKQVA